MATSAADSIDGVGFKGGVQDYAFEPHTLVARTFGFLRYSYALQTGRLVIWAPVFFAIGIWTYFNLPNEPNWIAVLGLAVPLVFLFWIGRRYPISMLIGLVVFGFCLSKLRQEIIATPLLRAAVTSSEISGFVADADNRGGKKRVLVIELDSATNIPAVEMPQRVRISTFDAPTALIGDYVHFSARLTPLPTPVMPNGFDYGRDLYFQSVGAMGSNISPVAFEDRPVPWKFAERRFFHKLRSVMGARITAAIPGPIGAFANSIVTGERAAIPAEMNTSLQISGLAHISHWSLNR